jgi:CO/xanthine dehydrogenase Mo-binding subunit
MYSEAGVNADLKPLTLAQIAANSGLTGGPLLGRASLNARGAGPGFSINMADVRVDEETGKVDVLRFTAIQDAGRRFTRRTSRVRCRAARRRESVGR